MKLQYPIYLGLILAIIGGELVAQSYLFLLGFLLFFTSYLQGKREEKILYAHFGKEYMEYKQKTKMLIPFIF